MVTANITFPADAARPVRRASWRTNLDTGRAAALSIVGIIVAMGIAMLALLVVPVAAAIVFGPALLELI